MDRTGKAEMGKLKQQQRPVNKVASEEEAIWRFSIPSTVPKDSLRELYKTQLPHFRTLLRAVESHPGFDWDAKPGDDILPSTDMTLSPSPKASMPPPHLPAMLHAVWGKALRAAAVAVVQGILMTQLTPDQQSVQQALMFLDAQRPELRIVGSVKGEPVSDSGCAFNTLRGALTAFQQWAATSPLHPGGPAAPQKAGSSAVHLQADATGHDLSLQLLFWRADGRRTRFELGDMGAWRAGPACDGRERGGDEVIAAVRGLRSADSALVRETLERIMELDVLHGGSDDWTVEWVAQGTLQVSQVVPSQALYSSTLHGMHLHAASARLCYPASGGP